QIGAGPSGRLAGTASAHYLKGRGPAMWRSGIQAEEVVVLDLAILLSGQPTLPPTRPEVVLETPAAGSRLTPELLRQAERLAEQSVSSYEAMVASYVQNLAARRARVEATAATRDMTEAELAHSLQVAGDLEKEADSRAVRLSQFLKRAARDEKAWFRRDPALGAIMRSMAARLAAADEMAIEALLEQALYVRAFRAQRNPDARGGQVFDDPDALDAFLRAEFA
ncbi:hypothetical protein, partial [Methylobacterium radiotolerans]|uniref:hypothetical protein n=1 Tax=Methylobacterium radiotolerans TaxID=31998 RepID=UPI001AECE135